jgi:hypothetical protein
LGFAFLPDRGLIDAAAGRMIDRRAAWFFALTVGPRLHSPARHDDAVYRPFNKKTPGRGREFCF